MQPRRRRRNIWRKVGKSWHWRPELFEGLHNKVEPDVDSAATKAALDHLLANEFGETFPEVMALV